ncbi:MAG: 2,3-bisphosphoglycerate-independent phosphoglycerate mutase [Candidatus Omnitrophica bacterium]|nr:2,3-bisphosphoglycerate-independent phosphoglycerate mutase [Candidatus Omnitrophota bacterium]
MVNELKKLKKFSGRQGPLLLVIMDGIGLGRKDDSDGVHVASTPCLDALAQEKLSTTLQAHGTAVGMPSDGDMGNSEVGHNALGAGRVFQQGATLVNASIADGSIFKALIWKQLMESAKEPERAFHFIGLHSDGNVHSHIDHLHAMVRHCAQEGVQKVRLHILLDGRDVYEKSAVSYIEKTEALLKELNEKQGLDYRIASGGGRMITTMDRYFADWQIVKRGWDAHVLGQARQFSSAAEAVQTCYDEDASVNDQFVGSFVIAQDGHPVGPIEDGDAVVFFNFRGDRAIELSMAFDSDESFDKFDRQRVPDVLYAGMMEYDGDLHIPKNYLVIPPQIDRTVSEFICSEGIKSFAISETQKFGHVTYFWNGNKSGYIDEKLEKYIEILSDKVQFQHAPRMKAVEITDKIIELLHSGDYKFGRVNFANGDMVGHTGIPSAIIEAVQTVDQSVKRLIDIIKELGGTIILTADHGNAEEMFNVKNGKKIVSTAHSLNPVPLVIIDSRYQGEYQMRDLEKKGLSNVAATILNLLGYEKPDDYDESLIEFV